jgi:hypothetical protein
VELVLEVSVSDNWGSSCTVDQIYKQAIQSALERVHALVHNGARVIGDPKVTMILVDAK